MADFADVEAMLMSHLRAEVTPKVYTRAPATLPDAWVRVWRTGGASINRVLDEALVTVEAWGKSPADTVAASGLAEACRRVLLDASGSVPLVRGVDEQAGPYFDPDPDTNRARYSMTFRVRVRARR